MGIAHAALPSSRAARIAARIREQLAVAGDDLPYRTPSEYVMAVRSDRAGFVDFLVDSLRLWTGVQRRGLGLSH